MLAHLAYLSTNRRVPRNTKRSVVSLHREVKTGAAGMEDGEAAKDHGRIAAAQRFQLSRFGPREELASKRIRRWAEVGSTELAGRFARLP